MTLRTRVKLNSVTHLDEARYGAGMGVEWIGFCLDNTKPAFVPPALFTQICGWITGVQRVGEFFQKSKEEIALLVKNYSIEWIQTDRLDELPSILTMGYPTMIRITDSHAISPSYLPANADLHILINLPEPISPEKLVEWKKKYPRYTWLIANTFTPEDSLTWSNYTDGLALCTHTEPHEHDVAFEQLRSMLEILETENNE